MQNFASLHIKLVFIPDFKNTEVEGAKSIFFPTFTTQNKKMQESGH
jgi:hypothetical protein